MVPDQSIKFHNLLITSRSMHPAEVIFVIFSVDSEQRFQKSNM